MGKILNESSVEDLITADESLEKNNKQQEYLEYIKNHVNNVKSAYQNYFIPLLDYDFISDKMSDQEIKDAIRNAATLVEEHDASKYSDEEFDGYREKYYPTAREKADPDFEKLASEKAERAWVSHYSNNPHHPMYWVNKETGDKKDMSLEYIIEMLCDWIGMSKGKMEGVWDWYRKKGEKERAAFTNKTKEIVEEFIFNILK